MREREAECRWRSSGSTGTKQRSVLIISKPGGAMAERHVCCTLHRPAVIAVLAVSIALAGCGREGTSAGDLATATDSAGILVIHNTAPVWQAGEEWHLEPEPTLDIGEEHGPPEVAFGYAHSPVRL